MKRLLMSISLALVLGCGRGEQASPETPVGPPKPVHDHAKEGPHGGVLAVWGDHEYHIEFKVDHRAGQATLYVLDGEAKIAQPIPAEQLLLNLKLTPAALVKLLPSPQPGDPPGSASAFVGTHDAFRKTQAFEGTISAQFGAKKYSGEFQESPHEAHPEATNTAGSEQVSARETNLFLKPGGIYTQADIEKNGTTVPSVKFKGVVFDHDDNLKPGDKI